MRDKYSALYTQSESKGGDVRDELEDSNFRQTDPHGVAV